MKLSQLMASIEEKKRNATATYVPPNNIYGLDDDADIEWDIMAEQAGGSKTIRTEIKEGEAVEEVTEADVMAADYDDALERAEEAEEDIAEALELLNEAAMIIEWFNKRDPEGEVVGKKSLADQLKFMEDVYTFLKQWTNMGRTE